jgi:beta-fructofuranosidase
MTVLPEFLSIILSSRIFFPIIFSLSLAFLYVAVVSQAFLVVLNEPYSTPSFPKIQCINSLLRVHGRYRRKIQGIRLRMLYGIINMMNYSPPGYYLWDFWLIHKPPDYHLFHLQAPRSLPDPELRHNAATIGHAESDDLRHWRNKGQVLGPGAPGEWDGLSVWTGSIIQKDSLYYMLYTGRSHAEQGAVQRIGLARSEDLYHWEKYAGNPVIEADAGYYEKFGKSDYYWESWRDPYVVYDGGERRYYAFITARESQGELDERGCIALARSTDLISWEVLPPVCGPRKFCEMEVPQPFEYGGRWYLLFSTNPYWYAERYRRQIDFEPWEGDHYLVADSLLGEYQITGDGVLSRANTHAYASKVIDNPEGRPVLISWLSRLPGRDEFAGVLSQPQSIVFDDAGVPDLGQ